MAQYIDKDALVAEIKRLHKAHSGRYGCDEVGLNLGYLEDFLDTLEVKEVDLEKEKDNYWNRLCDSEFGELLERDAKWFDDIANHFFKLGLKALKRE